MTVFAINKNVPFKRSLSKKALTAPPKSGDVNLHKSKVLILSAINIDFFFNVTDY